MKLWPALSLFFLSELLDRERLRRLSRLWLLSLLRLRPEELRLPRLLDLERDLCLLLLLRSIARSRDRSLDASLLFGPRLLPITS
jgi:hypothetical protein